MRFRFWRVRFARQHRDFASNAIGFGLVPPFFRRFYRCYCVANAAPSTWRCAKACRCSKTRNRDARHNDGREQVAQQGATIAQNLMVGSVDVSKQVTDSIANLRSTLGGVTDAVSAQAALPKLRDVTTQIDQVDGLIGQMTPEQKKLLAGIVNPLMPTLNQLFEKVLAIPGVSDVLKPTIDLLKAKLAMLTS
jgi:hypothetical protein